MKLGLWLASAVFVSCSFSPVSAAATLKFTASNIFDSTAPVTQYTAPGAVWSFSFTVDSNPAASQVDSAGFNVPFSGFIYSLNGASIVGAPLPQIRFFSGTYGGMLDVDFQSGSNMDMDPTTGLAFSGSSMFSGSTSAPTLQTGSYTATSGIFWSQSSPVQLLNGTVVVGGSTGGTVTPEPDTILEALAAGVCFMASGTMRRLSRRKS